MAIWKTHKYKRPTSKYSPFNTTKAQAKAFNIFRKIGEDSYANHCTQANQLKSAVEYLVRQNVVFVIGEGSEKRIVWNPLLTRKGTRLQIMYKARAYRGKQINENVRQEEEARRSMNTALASQRGAPIKINQADEKSILPYCDVKGTHIEKLISGSNSKGIGYVKDGCLIAFMFDGEFIGELPKHDESRKILITLEKIFFI